MATNARGLDCAVCGVKIVRKYDDIIQCSVCECNSHLKCINLTIGEYHQIISDRTVREWTCSVCNSKDITSVSELTNSHLADGKLEDSSYDSSEIPDNSSDVSNVTGKSMEVKLRSILAQINTALLGSNGRTCCCEDMLRELVEENRILKGLLESQSVIIQSMKDSFGKEISGLKAILQDGDRGCKRGAAVRGEPSLFLSQQGSVTTDSVEKTNGKSPKMATGGTEKASNSKLCSEPEKAAVSEGNTTYHGGVNTTVIQSTSYNDGAREGCSNTGSDHSAWTKVLGKRARGRKGSKPAVIGELCTANNTSLRAVPKKAYLHVTRLHPDTTCDEVKAFLATEFSEVECEALTSKFPEYYASFKVIINHDNKEKVMNPQLWPRGAYINTFFRRKNNAMPVK